jgi:hypothetical protein
VAGDYSLFLREPKRFGLSESDVEAFSRSMQGMLRIFVDPLIGREAMQERLSQFARESGTDFVPQHMKDTLAELSGVCATHARTAYNPLYINVTMQL